MSQSKKGISKIGVVGAGNMGSGIAQKIAQEGINVVMLDVKEEFVSRGLSNIKKILEEGIERKFFTPAKVQETLSRITATTDINALSDADIVIEAVFENKEVKSELFGKLDKICSPETILATNTSSFFVKELAEKTSRPDRFVGLHYFYHPAKNRLLEVIPHDKTSRETVEKSILAAKKAGLELRKGPRNEIISSFIENQILRLNEAGQRSAVTSAPSALSRLFVDILTEVNGNIIQPDCSIES